MMRRKQAELRSRHVGRGTVRGVAEAIFDGDGNVRISGEILGKKNHHLDTQPQGKQLAQSPEEHLMQSQITRDASASINIASQLSHMVAFGVGLASQAAGHPRSKATSSPYLPPCTQPVRMTFERQSDCDCYCSESESDLAVC